MPFERKHPNADLKKYYTIFIEVGAIITLLALLAAFKVDLRDKKENVKLTQEQEVVQMEEVVQTKQVQKPPPPPRPPVPVEVPNDEIVEDQIINLDAELDLDAHIDLPPPPKQAKKEDDNKDNFFVVVEQMPELIGGLAELQKNITYPDMARKAGIEGRVYVQFVVNEHGKVENPKVIRGIGGGCDKEALKAVRQARFKPGMQRGRPVRVQYSLPIVFKLQH